jgi:hypothetical protein
MCSGAPSGALCPSRHRRQPVGSPADLEEQIVAQRLYVRGLAVETSDNPEIPTV